MCTELTLDEYNRIRHKYKLNDSVDAVTYEEWNFMRESAFNENILLLRCKEKTTDKRKCEYCNERFRCYTLPQI